MYALEQGRKSVWTRQEPRPTKKEKDRDVRDVMHPGMDYPWWISLEAIKLMREMDHPHPSKTSRPRAQKRSSKSTVIPQKC